MKIDGRLCACLVALAFWCDPAASWAITIFVDAPTDDPVIQVSEWPDSWHLPHAPTEKEGLAHYFSYPGPGGPPPKNVVPISPEFVVTVAHWSSGAWSNPNSSLRQALANGTLEVTANGETYDVVDFFRLGDDGPISGGGDGTGGDFVVMKVVPEAGGSGLPDWANLNEFDELRYERFAVGSHGPHGKRFFDDMGQVQSVVNGVRSLAWGQGALNAAGVSPTHPHYVPGSAGAIVGDSGSGTYVRDGLDWVLVGIAQGTFGDTRFPGLTDFVEDAVSQMGGQLLPSPTQVVPTTVSDTIPARGASWFDANKWDAGVPTASDVAEISRGSLTLKGSGVAQELVVGGPTGAGLTITPTGSLDVRGAIVMANDPGTGLAQIRQTGEVTSTWLFVGHKGRAVYSHTNGVNTADTIHVGRHATADGSYFLSGAGHVDVRKLHVGHGVFHQNGGSVEAASLLIGTGAGESGHYEMLGGSLHAEVELRIGEGGSFLQDGGNLTAAGTGSGATSFVVSPNGTFEQNSPAALTHVEQGQVFIDGTMNIVGGSFIGGDRTTVRGTVNLQEGNVTAAAMSVSTSGLFNASGGVVNIPDVIVSGQLDVDTEMSGQTLNVFGGVAEFQSNAVMSFNEVYVVPTPDVTPRLSIAVDATVQSPSETSLIAAIASFLPESTSVFDVPVFDASAPAGSFVAAPEQPVDTTQLALMLLESDMYVESLEIGPGAYFGEDVPAPGARLYFTPEGANDFAFLKPGDANLDGVVNRADLAIWSANNGQTGTEWVTADFNGDRVTNLADRLIWKNSYTVIVSPVPEPAAAVWLLACAGVLGWQRRRA